MLAPCFCLLSGHCATTRSPPTLRQVDCLRGVAKNVGEAGFTAGRSAFAAWRDAESAIDTEQAEVLFPLDFTRTENESQSEAT